LSAAEPGVIRPVANEQSTFAKSDDLIGLLALFERFSIPGGEFIKIELIVDANIILGDIRWMLRKAKSEETRTALLEVLEAGTVACYAPEFLKLEILKNIPQIAEINDFDEDKVRNLWARFQSRINFIKTGDAPNPELLQDPKDWPYLRVQEIIGATILSKDTDIPAMGGRVAPITLTATLRSYARESAVELQLRFFGYAAIAIPAVLIFEVGKLVTQVVAKNIPTPPKWVWGASIGLVVALLIYPPSRAWLKNGVAALGKAAMPTMDKIIDLVQPLIADYEHARSEANKHLESAKSEAGV
jgi:predicted nucleic acid-binding protein